MNKKQKKNEFLELYQTILKLQEKVPEEHLYNRLKVLTDNIKNETFDYQRGMTYIMMNARKTKRKESAAIWSQVLKAFQEYFNNIK